jgi:UDP-2,3-diacylglucosamine hydrolase
VAAPQPVLRIADPEAALFASDMHLHESDPRLAERFFSRLQATLASALARTGKPVLFLLGDLFEYWIGDDHVPAIAWSMAERLSAFTRDGGSVFLMHGNRDFLIDVPIPSRPDVEAFSARCGASLLPDPAVIEVAGRRIALSHGDALCTDDIGYQQWRALCRSTEWQQQFLSLPVDERLAMAHALREQSLKAQTTTETTHDVNPAAVDALMASLDSDWLIHGHTHQPMLHCWSGPPLADGAGSRVRWVLSDWSVSPPRGSLVSLAAGVIQPAC